MPYLKVAFASLFATLTAVLCFLRAQSILPLVKTQVESQIKVRDFSRASVSIAPADFASWDDARASLLTTAKAPLKSQLQAELAAASDDAEKTKIRDAFAQREAAIEAEIDHKNLDLHLSLGISYNFLSR